MNKFKKNYIILLIPLFFAGVVFYTITLPILNEIKSTSQEFKNIKENQSFFQLEINEVEKFNQLLDSYKPFFERANKIFINPHTPIEFINFLEKKPQELNILLQTSSISPPIQKDVLTEINFNLIIYGSFANFLKFIKTIENSNYLVTIEDLVISELSEKESIDLGFNKPIIRSNMSIKLFTR